MVQLIILSLTFLSSLSVFAVGGTNAFTERCGIPHRQAYQYCSRGGSDCVALATACATGCADMTGFNASEREKLTGAPKLKQQCLDWGGTVSASSVGAAAATGAAARCDSAAAMLKDGKSYDQTIWETCVSDCSLAMEEATDTVLKQKYNTTASSCGEKISGGAGASEGEPIDSLQDTDEGSTVAESSDTADTGSPNNAALTSMLQGLASGSSMSSRIDAGRAVNFSGSVGGGGGGYESAAQGIGGLGPQPGDVIPPQIYNDIPGAPGDAPQGDRANFGANPGGGGGGMGGVGASGSGGSRGGGGAPGGARTSLAGAQLLKNGTNQFWAGGSGGSAPASKPGGRATAGAAKLPPVEKAKFGPEYVNKNQGEGLLRLWGAGQGKLPISRESQSCRDGVVFCSLENFDFEFKP